MLNSSAITFYYGTTQVKAIYVNNVQIYNLINYTYTNNSGILTSTNVQNLNPYGINWYWNGLNSTSNLVSWSDTSLSGSLPRTWLP